MKIFFLSLGIFILSGTATSQTENFDQFAAYFDKRISGTQNIRLVLRDFHDRILDHGSLPLLMVKENVFKES
jgi:hypothetical protein